MWKTSKKLIRHSILILALCFSFSAAAGKGPIKYNHFEAAKFYTVKVRSRVEYPFIKDEKGSFSGAGFLINRKLFF